MKKIIRLMILLTSIIFMSACSLSGNKQASAPIVTPLKATVETSSEVVSIKSNIINIQDFSFSPATLTISKGDTVTWTNNDSAPHQIKSEKFNSNMLSKGQNFIFTFSDSGTFDYNCLIHPAMTGKVIVQ